MVEGTFHVVRIGYKGEFRTYEIWVDNKPFLKPAKGKVLGKREAYGIVRLFNDGESSW